MCHPRLDRIRFREASNIYAAGNGLRVLWSEPDRIEGPMAHPHYPPRRRAAEGQAKLVNASRLTPSTLVSKLTSFWGDLPGPGLRRQVRTPTISQELVGTIMRHKLARTNMVNVIRNQCTQISSQRYDKRLEHMFTR